MARSHYNNGDEIGLEGLNCDGCTMVHVNGVGCHELGCPESWRDVKRDCTWCGVEFYPTERNTICADCIFDFHHCEEDFDNEDDDE